MSALYVDDLIMCGVMEAIETSSICNKYEMKDH